MVSIETSIPNLSLIWLLYNESGLDCHNKYNACKSRHISPIGSKIKKVLVKP